MAPFTKGVNDNSNLNSRAAPSTPSSENNNHHSGSPVMHPMRHFHSITSFVGKKIEAGNQQTNKFFSSLLSALPNPNIPNVKIPLMNELKQVNSTVVKKIKQTTKNQKIGISFSEWISFRKPKHEMEESNVQQLSKIDSVSSSMDEEISINLSQLLSQLDGLDQDDEMDKYTKFEKMEAFRMCLQCVYMPLFPQLSLNRDDKLETSNDIDLNLLKQTLKTSFSSIVNEREFNEAWRNIDNQYFPFRSKNTIAQNSAGSDLVKNAILFRKYLAENDLNPVYNIKKYANQAEYNNWKRDELNQISILLNTIDQQRTSVFLGSLTLYLNMLTIDIQKAFKKNANNKRQLFYKVSYVKHVNTSPIVFESDKIEEEGMIVNGRKDIPLPANVDHNITTSVEDQDIVIEFYHSQLKGLKKSHFASAKISLSNIMRKVYDEEGIWGSNKFSQIIDCYSTESSASNDNIIGCLSISGDVTFRRYPKNAVVQSDFSKENRIDWIEQYKIVLKCLIKARENLKDTLCEAFLCPSQAWILNDFEKRYGITETYKRLIYLEVFASNIKLAITFSEDLQKCLELLDNNIESKHFQMTLAERNRYFDLTEILVKKIEKALKKFISMFPKNQPPGALKSFVFVHRLLCCDYNNHISENDYKKKLKHIINTALQDHLDLILKDIMTSLGIDQMNGPVLVELCKELVTVVDSVFYYYGVFPFETFEMDCLQFYYSKFEYFINECKKNNTINGFYMLTLCSTMKALHDEIRNDFSEKDLEKFKFIDCQALSAGYADRYIGELRDILSKWIKQSIAVDTFEPVTDSTMHSTSVVDYFTSVNQVFEMLKQLDFSNSDLFMRFAELVIQITTTEYAKKLSDMCLNEIHSSQSMNQSESEKQSSGMLFNLIPKALSKGLSSSSNINILPIGISKQFVIRLNDIEACRQMLQNVVQTIFDSTAWQEYEDQEDALLDMDANEDGDIDFDSLEKKSNEKSKAIEEEFQKKSNLTIQKFSKQFNEMLFDLTLMTANIFQASIRNTITHILQEAKKDLQKVSGKTEVLKLFQHKSDSFLENTLFKSVLTPALEILSQNCLPELFQKILERLFTIVVEELSLMLFDPSNFTKKQQDRVFLTPQQVYVLESMLELFIIYFCGNEEDKNHDDSCGLISKAFIKSKSMLLSKLCKLYIQSTEKLESHLQKLSCKPLFAERHPIKAYHIVYVFFSRKKSDQKARKLYHENSDKAKMQRLIAKFNIYARYTIVEGSVKLPLLFSATCSDSTKYASGTLHVAGTFLLFEFRSSNVYHRISLNDITTIHLTEGMFSRKGISIHFNTSSNSAIFVGSTSNQKNGVKFYFAEEGLRTSLMECLQTQFKSLNRNDVKIINENNATTTTPNKSKPFSFPLFGKKRPITSESSDSIVSIIEGVVSDDDSEESREEVIKKRFDVANDEVCITDFSASVKIAQNSTFQASIFIFTSSFCVYSVAVSVCEKFAWNRVQKLTCSSSDGSLLISLKDFGDVTISNTLKANTLEFLNQFNKWKSLTDNVQTKKSQTLNLENLLTLTEEQANRYFLQKFQLHKISSKEKLVTYFIICNNQNNIPNGIAFVAEQYLCFEILFKPEAKDTVIPFTSIQRVKQKQSTDPESQLGIIHIETAHNLSYDFVVIHSAMPFTSLFQLVASKTKRSQTFSLNPFSMISTGMGMIGSLKPPLFSYGNSSTSNGSSNNKIQN
ncbi:hypothetical protein C9374_007162 [Naegleria lovaniensis]|uniref:Uncharacterized protein n=1 Tax=Naegleria lovaniensis TaxID=51637 RepID=A0AA88H4J0_NAELO|nr:uncharacterized protein C9374_007162 [Naegleria lovaniensis]KAG2393631.1 hypothetical protein C9374_007162 [Naegleria lovaniensis]